MTNKQINFKFCLDQLITHHYLLHVMKHTIRDLFADIAEISRSYLLIRYDIDYNYSLISFVALKICMKNL